MKFSVDCEGCVQSDDGMSLWHFEECLEEGKSIMDLVELVESINQ